MKSPLSNVSKRERVMLVSLLAVGLMIWGSLFMKRWDSVNTRLREARKETELQRIWLRSVPQFEAKRNEALAKLDRSRTLDASELIGWFDAAAREQKIRHTLSVPTIAADNIFTRNTLNVNLRNISLAQLLTLESKIRGEHPYLSLDELAISANPADQRLLNVRLEISSFEIN